MKGAGTKIFRQESRHAYSVRNRYSYQYSSSSIRIFLSAAHIRVIGLKEVVIDARDLTIRRAGIDDWNAKKLRHSMAMGTEDDSICGEYDLEKESEDIFRLIRIND